MSEGGKPNRDLTLKQQLWLEAYLGEAAGNATEAARIAGYAGNDNTLHVVGQQNLRNYTIRERVKMRLSEAKVTADEVVATLTAHMRADIADIVDEKGIVDLKELKARGLGHLIRSITPTKFGPKVELHSSFAGAAQLCKVLGIDRAPK